MINPYHPLTRGLLTAYLFNERGGGIAYDSMNQYTGTVSGADWTNNGMNFVAANVDYVDILDSVAGGHIFAGLSDHITVICGVNPDIVAGTATYWRPYNTIIELRQQLTGGCHVTFSFGIDTSKVFLGVADNYSTSYDRTFSSSTVTVNTEYNLGFTIDGDDYRIYINGLSDANGTFTSTGNRSVGSTACNLQIGIRSRDDGTKDSNPYDGIIKYLYIYERTLSQPEMMWLDYDPYGMFEMPYAVRTAEISYYITRFAHLYAQMRT